MHTGVELDFGPVEGGLNSDTGGNQFVPITKKLLGKNGNISSFKRRDAGKIS
jgi:hypothetical protein